MGQIKHHLSDSLLMAYAGGTLSEAFSLVVATHVSLCDECRARLGEFDVIGGCLLDRCESVPVATDALARTIAQIGGGVQEHAARTRCGQPGDLPQPLHDYTGRNLDEIRWRPMGGGVSQMRLATSSGATARLLRIPGGTRLPDHGHRGLELTLVLSGAFHDEDDRFTPGDLEIADQATQHTPHADAGQDCICLAATDAPLRFRGIVQRMAQPFLGI